uniref:Striatin n=1 Tax=Denticeps clupeoides TaxID=299321 RepID=A0AAY4EP36_9TELE
MTIQADVGCAWPVERAGEGGDWRAFCHYVRRSGYTKAARRRRPQPRRPVPIPIPGLAMDEQAGPGVFFSNNNNSVLPGGGRGAPPGEVGGGEAARAQYSIPGILHFLQHEWARFEVERAHWDVERAELQAQIAFLQGERKGQENLKKDLVRRIKMLEYALKQERAKYHKLKYGTELNQADMRPPSYDSGEELPELPNSQLSWKQGRQLLRQYLQEVGYTDTILDVKSQRVKALLGLAGDTGERPGDRNTEPMVNGTEPMPLKDSVVMGASCVCAEKEETPGEAWDVDQDLISRLKEQYRKERKGKKGVKSNQLTLVSNGITAALWLSGAYQSCFKALMCVCFVVEAMTFPPSSGKSFIMGADETLESVLGLGELAGLTVANEAESMAYDISGNKDLRKTWNPKFTLRSHFDSIRGLAFHPVEPVLITASEDHTLKMWNLQKTAPTKKCAALDVEPIYTFRAHRGAVLCVVMTSNGDQCFSGGVDGTIQSWNTPNPYIDPYDSYEPSALRGALCGHSDSVWGLVYSSAHHRLLSCSADGTVCLWNAAETSPALTTFNQNKDLGIPTSVDLVCSDPAYMVTAFNTGEIGIFNMETQQLVLNALCHINKILSHPTLPVTITAQEDRHIRFYDNNTGKLIHSMVAHLDAVTSLAVDPNGLYLMSGSHDCSIRLWNMESKTCIQEFTAHRKKFDESIHAVAFHPSKCFIGSAGADALAKVFV